VIDIVKQLNLNYRSGQRAHEWQVEEESFSLKNNPVSESIFTLGNGYLGIRGSFEEGLEGDASHSIEGIYINGFYESVPIPHAERGFGYAYNSQTILNVTDSKIIELYLGEERFSLNKGELLKFKRLLDFKEGYLLRELIWRSPGGKEIRIVVKRLVSFAHRHLMAFQYRLEPLNFSGKITIHSSLNGNVDNHMHEEEDPRFSASLGGLGLSVTDVFSKKAGAVMIQKTSRSKLALACAMENLVTEGIPAAVNNEQTDETATVEFLFEGRKNQVIALEKYVAYYTSREHPIEELPTLAENMVREAAGSIGFKSLLVQQVKFLDTFWDTVGIDIKGDKNSKQSLRFNLFHLLQAGGFSGQTGIAAKGLTSEGYDGHYFWDTEIYMVPFFAALFPEKARKLLEYRYHILGYARIRARELAHEQGALFPWRTIAGEEGSSYFPAGTAQYHINSAIAWAISKYIEMTGDYSFMLDYGAEILFETARLWEDLGAYIPAKGGKFCCNEVTGPDEYTALVNNNCYTNLMAQWHLEYAYETALYLESNHPAVYQKLAETIKLQPEEPQAWRMAAENMYIPYDKEMKIHPQDDSFLEKVVWDFSATPADNYPLMLHYHPLVIYRHQVCKQPDLLLAHFLLTNRFDPDQKRRDYDYYAPITTHDSSLSPSIFSIIASELGYRDDAEWFFGISTRLDLENILKDTHYGLHMANMAGSWLCVVHGFGGMRTKGEVLKFNPYCPQFWQGYKFRIIYKSCLLEVEVDANRAVYHLIDGGDTVKFVHRDHEVVLSKGEKAVLDLS